MPFADLRATDYYRMPWTLTDNVLGWLEPTKKCNLTCFGCYSRNDASSEKSLDQVRADMDAFVSQRQVDSISIAGGDPLTHPQIVDIVRMIREDYDLKPVLNTNGIDLTPELLKQLKQAGVFGFTFHIDSKQSRRGWTGKTEQELCELRLHYAQMVAQEGGMSCAFNSTIYRDTMHAVPDLMDWAAEHIDIVHSMVFILFRTMRTDEFQYFARGEQVDLGDDAVYEDSDVNPEPITARELVALMREREPLYEPAAYLGGTEDPDAFKWLMAARFGDKHEVHGYAGPRFMEALQVGHHLLKGRYMAYSAPELAATGRSQLPLFGALDRGVRSVARRWLTHGLRHPGALRRKLYVQSLVIIQPIDMQPGGEISMCDGCPDMTIHNGELAWSCRLDEQLRFGCFLTAAPRQEQPEA